MRILVVDDDRDVAALTAMGITYHRPQFVVSECYGGADAIARIGAERPDLVLLDLAMPDRDGFSVLSELRDGGSDVPVIVVTAKGLEQEKIRGLELGADDYVTKPFGHGELVARIDAVLRRYRAESGQGRSNVLSHDGLVINFATRTVTSGGREVRLTPTEYNLLYHLATNAGRVMTHETLLAKVWGREYRDEVHYLKVYAGRLRTKLEPEPQQPRYILTVRGVGYRFPALAT